MKDNNDILFCQKTKKTEQSIKKGRNVEAVFTLFKDSEYCLWIELDWLEH